MASNTSINDLQDSLLIHSGAKETSDKSSIHDGLRKLRRRVRSSKPAPLPDISNSVVSENEGKIRPVSPDNDSAEIQDFDIQEKDNELNKRSSLLKRRVTRKTFSPKASPNVVVEEGKTRPVSPDGDSAEIQDFDIQEKDNEINKRSSLLKRRVTRKTFSPSKSPNVVGKAVETKSISWDTLMQSDTDSIAKEISDKSPPCHRIGKLRRRALRPSKPSLLPDVSNSLVSEHKDNSVSPDIDPADIQDIDIQEQDNGFRKVPIPLKRRSRPRKSTEQNATPNVVANEMDSQGSSWSTLMQSDTESYKKFSTPDCVFKSSRLQTRLAEINNRCTAKYLEDIAKLQPNLSITLDNASVGTLEQLQSSNHNSQKSVYKTSRLQTRLAENKNRCTEKYLEDTGKLQPNLSIAHENAPVEPLEQLPSSNPESPKSVYKTPQSVTQLSFLVDNSKQREEPNQQRKLRRKSVYHAGSQQQEAYENGFGNEPIQNFSPNIESTRLMQNTVLNDDTRPLSEAGQSDDVYADVEHNEPNEIQEDLSRIPTEPLTQNPSTSTNLIYPAAQSRQKLSSANYEELAQRLKSIGCWNNNDKIAEDVLKDHQKRRLDTVVRNPQVQNGPTGKQPRFKPQSKARKSYTSLLHPKEICYLFERFSGLTLTKGCLPVLVDAFQKFTKLMIKKLLENGATKKVYLGDIRKVMSQFGFIPKKDFKNMELYSMLRRLMDPEDYRLIMPMSTFNGIRGSTTLPKDIWGKQSKSRKKDSRRK